MRAFWRGFTLAEVLITLTIIGIIAALTIPSLMTKVQDHGFRSAFLKNYAVIQNAYQKSIRDGVPFYDPTNYTGVINPIYISDPNLMKDYFKIQKGPFYNGDGGGWLTFNHFYPNFTKRIPIKYLNGSYLNSFLPSGFAFTFQLTDGTVISFCKWSYNVYNIFIDVNGRQGPNTYGRDIYWLNAYLRNDLGRYEIYPRGYNYNPSDCRLNSNGYACAYEIVRNKSFKIPKE